MKKKVNPKAIATKMIKYDLRHVVFLMLPAFETLVPVHFDSNKRKLLMQPYTVKHYRDVRLHWNVALFVLTRNVIDGSTLLEYQSHTFLNATYTEAGLQALQDLEDWTNKINRKCRVNVGFAITQREQQITLEDCQRWVLNDPEFGIDGDVITVQDEKRELANQIKLMEKLL